MTNNLSNKIREKLKERLVDSFGIPTSKITDNATFATDLGLDSLDLVELHMYCEEDFLICIEDEEAEKIKTLGEAILFIEKLSPIFYTRGLIKNWRSMKGFKKYRSKDGQCITTVIAVARINEYGSFEIGGDDAFHAEVMLGRINSKEDFLKQYELI